MSNTLLDHAPPPPRPPLLKRLWQSGGLWAIADQGIVSLGNFITQLLMLRALGLEDYGALSVIWLVMLLCLALHASLVTMPLALLGAARPHRLARLHTNSCLFTLGLLPLLAAIVVGAALLAGRPEWGVYTALALGGRMLHECSRRTILARVRPKAAIPGDAVAYLGLVAGLLAAGWFVELNAELALTIVAAAGLGGWLVQLPGAGWAWAGRLLMWIDIGLMIRRGVWLVGAAVTQNLLVQACPWALFLAHGAVAAGQMAAAANLLNLANPLLIGLSGFIIPVVAAHAQTPRHALRLGMKWAGVEVFLAGVYFLAILMIAPMALEFAYGQGAVDETLIWVLRWMAFAYFPLHVGQMIVAILTGFGRPRSVFIAQSWGGAGELFIGVPAAVLGGVIAAAQAGIAANLLLVAAAALLLRSAIRSSREPDRSRAEVLK